MSVTCYQCDNTPLRFIVGGGCASYCFACMVGLGLFEDMKHEVKLSKAQYLWLITTTLNGKDPQEIGVPPEIADPGRRNR